MAETFTISNTDTPNTTVEIIERFTLLVAGVQTEFATHANTGHALDGLKKISHYRSGMCVTLIPIKADIAACRMEVERVLARYDRRHIIQRFNEPITLNPAASTNPPKEDDMSLEDAIIKNTAAVAELTAALLQHIANNPGKAAAAAADTASADKPKAKEKAAAKEEKKPEPEKAKAEEKPAALSLETDIKPLAVKVSIDKGRDILVALLQRMGCTVGKTSELAATQYAEFMDLAGKVLSGEYNPMASEPADDEV